MGREDYKIESSIDFQITYESSYARLVIREAFAEDSGRFTCTATSEAGTISTSCFLLVKVSEELESREESASYTSEAMVTQTASYASEAVVTQQQTTIAAETKTETVTESAGEAAAPFFIKTPAPQ